MGARVGGYVTRFWGRLWDALPTIGVYALLFLTVVLLFGSRYAIIVTCATTLFNLRRRRRLTAVDYGKMFAVTVVLCLLAYLATWGAALCVLLNFAVPFLLVMLQSSQFAPKGHFVFAMTFVFLELRPVSPTDFRTQLFAVILCTLISLAALALYARRHTPADPRTQVDESMEKLAGILERLAEGETGKEIRAQLYQMTQSFQKLGYTSATILPDREGRQHFYHMFALLLQRAEYLVEDANWNRDWLHPQGRLALNTLAGLVRQIRSSAGPGDRVRLAGQVEALLAHTDLTPLRRIEHVLEWRGEIPSIFL